MLIEMFLNLSQIQKRMDIEKIEKIETGFASDKKEKIDHETHEQQFLKR